MNEDYIYKIIGQTRFSKWMRKVRGLGQDKITGVTGKEVAKELEELVKRSITNRDKNPVEIIKQTRFAEWLPEEARQSLVELSIREVEPELKKIVELASEGQEREFGFEFQCYHCFGVFSMDEALIRQAPFNGRPLFRIECKRCANEIFYKEDEARRKNSGGFFF